MSEARKTVGQKVREIRKEKGFSLRELGEAAGASYSYMCDVERGYTARPSAERLLLIARKLGVTMDYLADENLTERDDAVDNAFFDKYRRLPPKTKKKIRETIDIWTPTTKGR